MGGVLEQDALIGQLLSEAVGLREVARPLRRIARGNQVLDSLLVDRSTNGTWVLTDGGDTFRVTREEITLAGSGRILPGRQNLEPLRYRVGPQTPA